MNESTRPGILTGVREGQFISEWIALEESDGVSDSNVEVRPGNQFWPIKVRSVHCIKLRACSTGLKFARRLVAVLANMARAWPFLLSEVTTSISYPRAAFLCRLSFLHALRCVVAGQYGVLRDSMCFANHLLDLRACVVGSF